MILILHLACQRLGMRHVVERMGTAADSHEFFKMGTVQCVAGNSPKCNLDGKIS